MSFFPLLFSVLLLGCLNGTLNSCVDLFPLRFRASEKNPIFLFVPRISLSILASRGLLLGKFTTVLKEDDLKLRKRHCRWFVSR